MFWEEQRSEHIRLLKIARVQGNARMEALFKRLTDDAWDELVTTKAHLQMCIKPTK